MQANGSTDGRDGDRVRAHTAPELNQRIDRDIRRSIQETAGHEVGERIGQLETEWSVERVLDTQAAAAALLGLALSLGVNSLFLAIPVLVSGGLWWHGLRGGHALLGVFRRLGLRTRSEIDREKYGLKARRGDLASLEGFLESDPQAVEHDLVRQHDAGGRNLSLEQELQERVRLLTCDVPAALVERLQELRQEWDVERVLQVHLPVLALLGMGLSFSSRIWLALPAAAFACLLQHALQGWCPALPTLRQVGVRTRQEIDRERYALIASLIEKSSLDH